MSAERDGLRLSHWLLSGSILLALTLIVPVIASFY